MRVRSEGYAVAISHIIVFDIAKEDVAEDGRGPAVECVGAAWQCKCNASQSVEGDLCTRRHCPFSGESFCQDKHVLLSFRVYTVVLEGSCLIIYYICYTEHHLQQ